MGEEEKKDVTEEPKDVEEEETKEIADDPGDIGHAEEEAEPEEEEAKMEPEEEDIEAEPEAEEDLPDKSEVAKLKREIESSIKRKVRSGQSRDVARNVAYIEARRKALKTLGYIPKGFYKDKD